MIMVYGLTGPAGIAILLLLGWIFARNPILKITCGVLLLAWFMWILWITIVTREWIILVQPGCVVIAWGLISGIKNTFDPDD